MTKALSLILGGLMLVQIIYPLGLPGLRRRTDAWKIAVLALALVFAAATLRPAASPDPGAAASAADDLVGSALVQPRPETAAPL